MRSCIENSLFLYRKLPQSPSRSLTQGRRALTFPDPTRLTGHRGTPLRGNLPVARRCGGVSFTILWGLLCDMYTRKYHQMHLRYKKLGNKKDTCTTFDDLRYFTRRLHLIDTDMQKSFFCLNTGTCLTRRATIGRLELPLGRGRFVDPSLEQRAAPTSMTAYTVRGSSEFLMTPGVTLPPPQEIALISRYIMIHSLKAKGQHAGHSTLRQPYSFPSLPNLVLTSFCRFWNHLIKRKGSSDTGCLHLSE